MKPTKIIKIKFTKQEQEEIDLINKGQLVSSVKTRVDNKTGAKYDVVYHKRFTFETAQKRLFQLHGGLCRCGQWPLYKVMVDVGDERQGAWQVYRYCQKHYDEWKKMTKK